MRGPTRSGECGSCSPLPRRWPLPPRPPRSRPSVRPGGAPGDSRRLPAAESAAAMCGWRRKARGGTVERAPAPLPTDRRADEGGPSSSAAASASASASVSASASASASEVPTSAAEPPAAAAAAAVAPAATASAGSHTSNSLSSMRWQLPSEEKHTSHVSRPRPPPPLRSAPPAAAIVRSMKMATTSPTLEWLAWAPSPPPRPAPAASALASAPASRGAARQP